MLRLITDFDGPIMDVSDRYYWVYQYCLAQTKCPGQIVYPLSKAKFWQLKRSRIPEQQIGLQSGLDAEQAREFARLRRVTVHTLPYLAYDSVIPGSVTALEKIQQAGADIAVMTMRHTWELDYVFRRYNLGRFFPKDRCYCLSNDYVKASDVADKPLLMARAIAELPPAHETWMVGDTEADIVAAKTYGVKVIGVLSGIRDRHQLEQYQPDRIVNNLSEAVELMLEMFLQRAS
jgi:phosphoglycolate phosphatase-like HAD superfamily hydrolase